MHTRKRIGRFRYLGGSADLYRITLTLGDVTETHFELYTTAKLSSYHFSSLDDAKAAFVSAVNSLVKGSVA
jgi:hypothetical protein